MLQRREKKKSGKRKKNREIMQVTISVVVIFLGMMGYFTVYSLTHREELFNNSYNGRQQILAAQNKRGEIYARGGEILAESEVDGEGNEKRVYPYGNLFSHVVGYVDKGKTGIESQANYYLTQSSISAASRAKMGVEGEKNPGDRVYTTFDLELQEAADRALGIYKGAIVAMDPKTGEILAMVSKPDFDPNQIVDQWDGIIADEESGILVNRATQGLYPPGSTFKIVTALEYIKENPETYANYRFTCNGSIREGDSVINCYHGTKHGEVDLGRSFAKSCNTSFANIGLMLDREKFSDTLNTLLFNQELPLECVYNQSSVLILEGDDDGEMMQNAIGQGRTQITPVHLAMITSAVANNGVLMKPYMVQRVESAEGAKVKEFSPEEYAALMSPEEASILKGYMEDVVISGTGSKLAGLSYTAAGKTGSAEFNSTKEESHAWFTGFAPVSDPRIVVTVIIEGAGSGGDYAVPMARRVFDAYLGEKDS